MFLYDPAVIISDMFEALPRIQDTETLTKKAEILKSDIAANLFAGFNNAACELLDAYRNRYRELRANPPAPIDEVSVSKSQPATEVPATRTMAEPVADATYTVAMSDSKWYTVRISTVETGNLAGKRIAEFLSGPDNETDFQGFAFVNDDGTVTTWKRFRTPGYLPYQDALNMVLGYPKMAPEFREAYALKSGRCSRCGRKLTVPASIHRGLGPECAKLIG